MARSPATCTASSRVGTTTSACGLPGSGQLVVALLAGRDDAVQQRDAEAEGLAGAGLGLADDVVAGQRHRQGHRLDGERVRDARRRRAPGRSRGGRRSPRTRPRRPARRTRCSSGGGTWARPEQRPARRRRLGRWWSRGLFTAKGGEPRAAGADGGVGASRATAEFTTRVGRQPIVKVDSRASSGRVRGCARWVRSSRGTETTGQPNYPPSLSDRRRPGPRAARRSRAVAGPDYDPRMTTTPSRPESAERAAGHATRHGPASTPTRSSCSAWSPSSSTSPSGGSPPTRRSRRPSSSASS